MLFLLLCSLPAHALPADAIGRIQTLQGTAVIQRGNVTLPAAVGAPLYRGDLIRTAKPGAAGVVLTDDSTVTLGPNSELSLKEYAFDPKEEKFSLVVRMVKGTFVYLSGLIGKLAPNAVHLVIPDATIAVRGTKLLVDVHE
jgi:hypothetical protein